jgi:uncharacterized membrane protein YbaN (DUF454 family)
MLKIALGTVLFIIIELVLYAMTKPRFIDWIYKKRMDTSLRLFLMPGRLAEKTYWASIQRMFVFLGMVLGVIVYIQIMLKIAKQ